MFKDKNIIEVEATFVSLELNDEKAIQVFVNDITEKSINEIKTS